jgi:peptidoglycan/xylan/chitin deacetylase (PgdA/CDA1 family)
VNGFPVLMYHALADGPSTERYTLPEDRFRAQLEALARADRPGVSLATFLDGGGSDGRAVVLTFDDGHRSDRARALPVLQEFGCTATFFVTTGRIGTDPDFMDWDDVAALHEAGMDVQAHGHTHRFLDDLPEVEQATEVETPAALLEKHLGRRPTAFSFPGGRYTAFALEAARAAGYRALCTSEPGLNPPGAGDDALIRRYVVHQGTSEADFLRMAGLDDRFAARARNAYRAKRAAKRLLGNRAYYVVWKALKKPGAA